MYVHYKSEGFIQVARVKGLYNKYWCHDEPFVEEEEEGAYVIIVFVLFTL